MRVILKLGRLDTGLRWHVRDYLRHKCSRVLKITAIEDGALMLLLI
jgi:hypothetical protein